MSEQPLAVGDVVRLKCGGAEMVVAKLQSTDYPTITCKWHKDGDPREQEYEPEILVLVHRPGLRAPIERYTRDAGWGVSEWSAGR